MTFRRVDLGIVLVGAVALVLSLIAVSFVIDAIVDSDVRDEMAQALEALHQNLDLGFDLIDRSHTAFAGGAAGDTATELDALKAQLMRVSCQRWPQLGDGFLLCFRPMGDEMVSSGSASAREGERASEVFGDFARVRQLQAGEFFNCPVYGEECLCRIADYRDCRTVSVVPLKSLKPYRMRALKSLAPVLALLVVSFTFGALRRSVLMARLKGYIDGEKTRLKNDLEAAWLVQMSALPPPFPPQSSYVVKARMDPAKVVGGDFYDFQVLPSGKFYFLVADVAGKGISAAMFMMRAKSVIRQCLSEARDLAIGMTQANAILAANNDTRLFVTVWVGVLNPWTGHIAYVNAGHNPPVVLRQGEAGARLEWVKCQPSLVMALMPETTYAVHELTLAPGERFFLYTDGVTEAQDGAGRFYGERRLERVLLSSGGGDCLAAVRAGLDAFQGAAEPADDVTMLALDYLGTPPGTARGFPCTREGGFPEAVRFVEDELIRAECPDELRKKFLLAFDEVGSNVVSYSGAPDFTVKVAVEATPPAVTLTVTDAGRPFNPLDRAGPDLQLSVEQRISGGYGIFITRQFMDEVIYSRDEGRNVLTLRKSLGGAGFSRETNNNKGEK